MSEVPFGSPYRGVTGHGATRVQHDPACAITRHYLHQSHGDAPECTCGARPADQVRIVDTINPGAALLSGDYYTLDLRDPLSVVAIAAMVMAARLSGEEAFARSVAPLYDVLCRRHMGRWVTVVLVDGAYGMPSMVDRWGWPQIAALLVAIPDSHAGHSGEQTADGAVSTGESSVAGCVQSPEGETP